MCTWSSILLFSLVINVVMFPFLFWIRVSCYYCFIIRERSGVLLKPPVLFPAFPRSFTGTPLKPSCSRQQNGGTHWRGHCEGGLPRPQFHPSNTDIHQPIYIIGGGEVNRCSQCLLGKVAFPLLGQGAPSHELPLTSRQKLNSCRE